MLRTLKTFIRDSLPRRYQVPLKFWYSKLRGDLEAEMDLLPTLLQPSDIVIDVGANRGVYAYFLDRIGVTVELFEPNPACTQILDAWAAHRSNIHLHSVALSDQEGVAKLHIPVDDAGVEHDAAASVTTTTRGSYRELVVPLATLDSYQIFQASLIKIDVEGHEFAVLQGANMTIECGYPALLIEIERRHIEHSFSSTFDFLHAKGYCSFFLDAGSLRHIDEFIADRDQTTDGPSERRSRYINNFLFLHKSHLESGRYQNLFYRSTLR